MLTKTNHFGLLLVTCLIAVSLVRSGIALQNKPDCLELNSIRWLAGNWAGQAKTNDGPGEALALWTSPLEGAMSWTFRWHMPDSGHSHYAFNVIEETPEGVFIRGIHHGRNFKTFEEQNWSYKLIEASATKALFACHSNCRAEAVTFTLNNGKLREAWTAEGDPSAFVVNYIAKNPVPTFFYF